MSQLTFEEYKNYPDCVNFRLDMIYNSQNLNIFSDASMRKRQGDILDSCYGSVILQGDTVIDECFKLSSDCTVPAAELRGIRLSLDFALRYRYMAPVINIFSDSELSIRTLREYYYTWAYDYNTNMYYAKSNIKEPARNQELVIECMMMLNELARTNIVRLYHQKGHVDNGEKSLKNAINVFKRVNNIRGKVDFNLIRYISTYNNYIDEKSRSIIRRTDIYNNTYRDPVTFHPIGNPKVIYQNQI